MHYSSILPSPLSADSAILHLELKHFSTDQTLYKKCYESPLPSPLLVLNLNLCSSILVLYWNTIQPLTQV